MVHWIYILQCENGGFYVGKTKRLYRRFWEHSRGSGGVNTCINSPESIVAVYKCQILEKFHQYCKCVSEDRYNIFFDSYRHHFNEIDGGREEGDYDYLDVENLVTESLLLNSNDPSKIKGGKYVRNDVKYILPEKDPKITLPLCNCGIPCDVRKNDENDFLYFRCAKKNMWCEMKEELDIYCEPCKFFMKYDDDEYLNRNKEKNKLIFDKLRRSGWWLSSLVGGQWKYCLGDCGKTYNPDNTIRYRGRSINLCFDCFLNKDDLPSKLVRCMIEDD